MRGVYWAVQTGSLTIILKGYLSHMQSEWLILTLSQIKRDFRHTFEARRTYFSLEGYAFRID